RAVGAALAAPVFVEDAAAPAGQASPPVLVPRAENNPCFTGKGTIKDVLDACAAFMAEGSTDTDKIAAAHGNRAIGLSATKDFDGAVNEMNEAIRLEPKEPNLYFMRSAAYRAKRDFDKAVTDIDQAIALDAARG